MKINNALKLFASIIICQLAGIVGSFFTVPAIPGWYAELTKPALNPPTWVFGPAWTMLYILMGVALFLIWQKGLREKRIKTALAVFAVQLLLNTLWSVVFFGLQSPGWALLNIAVLWAAILWTIVVFYKISKPASYLLVPYILWVSFALYLNYSIWVLN